MDNRPMRPYISHIRAPVPESVPTQEPLPLLRPMRLVPNVFQSRPERQESTALAERTLRGLVQTDENAGFHPVFVLGAMLDMQRYYYGRGGNREQNLGGGPVLRDDWTSDYPLYSLTAADSIPACVNPVLLVLRELQRYGRHLLDVGEESRRIHTRDMDDLVEGIESVANDVLGAHRDPDFFDIVEVFDHILNRYQRARRELRTTLGRVMGPETIPGVLMGPTRGHRVRATVSAEPFIRAERERFLVRWRRRSMRPTSAHRGPPNGRSRPCGGRPTPSQAPLAPGPRRRASRGAAPSRDVDADHTCPICLGEFGASQLWVHAPGRGLSPKIHASGVPHHNVACYECLGELGTRNGVLHRPGAAVIEGRRVLRSCTTVACPQCSAELALPDWAARRRIALCFAAPGTP